MEYQKYLILNFRFHFDFHFKFKIILKDFILNSDDTLNLIFFKLSEANLTSFNFFVEFMIPTKLSEKFLI